MARGTAVLLRLDIRGTPHRNPDRAVIVCPHLHVYKAGFQDAWAYPVPAAIGDTENLVACFESFLRYCKVVQVPQLRTVRSLFDGKA